MTGREIQDTRPEPRRVLFPGVLQAGQGLDDQGIPDLQKCRRALSHSP